MGFQLDDQYQGIQALYLAKIEFSNLWFGRFINWNIANICKSQMCFTLHLITFH